MASSERNLSGVGSLGVRMPILHSLHGDDEIEYNSLIFQARCVRSFCSGKEFLATSIRNWFAYFQEMPNLWSENIRGRSLRIHAGSHGYVVVECGFCPNTTEFLGMAHAEEKMKSQGWTVRRGMARCPACSEIERLAIARAVRRSWLR